MNWDEFENIFKDCELKGNKIVIKSKLFDVIEFIVNNYPYNVLKQIVAVDNKDGIELIYNLFSIDDGEDLFISIIVDNEVESIISLFDSAIADENEIYDMFGIKFINNDNLKRIYMPEDWEGFPLRKDYVETDMRLAWNDKD